MNALVSYLKADFIKVKYTTLCIAHLVIPIMMAGIFLAYYAVSPWNAYSKIQAFYQIMGMGYPFLIGVFCAVTAEQERTAGNYQAMLATADRRIPFFSKLLLLILLGVFSVTVASAMFGTGYFWGLKQRAVGYSFYWIVAAVMLGSSLFLYILHLFLALRMNQGITIGIGIAESLLSALCLTGLGERVWVYIPAAWAGRMTGYVLAVCSGTEVPLSGCRKAAMVCVMVTLVSFIMYGIWACRWDGRDVGE